MNTHTNDNSSAAELDKCITWQYDKATNLVAFIGMLGDFFAQATQGLWDSWKNKVCDIDTADDFGLSVWGKILDCPRPVLIGEGYKCLKYPEIRWKHSNAPDSDYYKNFTIKNQIVGNKVIKKVSAVENLTAGYNSDGFGLFILKGENTWHLPELPLSEYYRLFEDYIFIDGKKIICNIGKGSISGSFVGAHDQAELEYDFLHFRIKNPEITDRQSAEAFLSNHDIKIFNTIEPVEYDLIGNLSTSLYRSILKARAQLLASHGTVEDYKQYVQTAFDGHFTVVDDNGMGLRFEATDDVTDEERALANEHPDVAFLWPCGVRDSSKIADGEFSITAEDDSPALDNAYLNGEIKPLRFTSEQDGSTICLKKDSFAPTVSLEYSFNGGSWNDYTYNALITLNKDEYVEFRAKTTNTTFSSEDGGDYNCFCTRGRIAASGNVMSLLSKDGSVGLNAPYCLAYIFSNWIDENSDGLTEPPELPAVELCENCYESMFGASPYLRHVPKLPATHIPSGAYESMFLNCSLITETPDLTHITSTGGRSFRSMFSGCTSLKNVRFAPLNTTEGRIYYRMFNNCTALERIPFDTFPAEILSIGCYTGMFNGCTNLRGKFRILGKELIPADGSGASGCCDSMFKDCSLINRIEVNFKEWKGDASHSATKDWVSGVAATGEFICPSGLPISFGNSRVPTGWRVAGGNMHNVTIDYYNGDQRVVEVQQVLDGGDATAPSSYQRTGYDFVGWSRAFTNITSDVTIVAQYSISTVSVTFDYYEGSEHKTLVRDVDYGAYASPPENYQRTGYNFIGWDGDFTKVTEDITVHAQYEIIVLTVTFKYYYGTEYKTTQTSVNYGATVTPPSNHDRDGYIFTGWDKTLSNITENTTINAVYVEAVTVRFEYVKNGADAEYTSTIPKGGNVIAPSDFDRHYYKNSIEMMFDEWDSSLENIQQNKTISALYVDVDKCTLSFRVNTNGYWNITSSSFGAPAITLKRKIGKDSDWEIVNSFDTYNIPKDEHVYFKAPRGVRNQFSKWNETLDGWDYNLMIHLPEITSTHTRNYMLGEISSIADGEYDPNERIILGMGTLFSSTSSINNAKLTCKKINDFALKYTFYGIKGDSSPVRRANLTMPIAKEYGKHSLEGMYENSDVYVMESGHTVILNFLDTSSYSEGWNKDMLKNSKGTFTGDPQIGVKYYDY